MIDDGNEYANVSDLARIAAVAADDATNSGAHFLGVFESSYEIGTDVFLRVASANGKNEDHVGFIQPRAAKPVGVAGFPALIVHSRCEFGNIVRRGVCFDLSDLAKVADRMGSVPCPSADTKQKQSAAAVAQVNEQIGGPFDSRLVDEP